MRIQLNKLGTEDPEIQAKRDRDLIPSYVKSIEKPWSSRENLFLFYICPSCRAELYGHWRWNENFYVDYELLPDQQRTAAEKIHDKVIKDRDRYSKLIGEEFKQILELSRCPICNAELKKEWPFMVRDEDDRVPGMFRDRSGRVPENNRLPYPIDLHNIYNVHRINRENWEELCWFKHDFPIVHDEIHKSELHAAKADTDAFCESCDIVQPDQAPNASVKDSLENLKSYISNLINMESDIISLTKRLEQLYFERSQNAKDLSFQRNYPLYDLKSKYSDEKEQLEKSKSSLTKAKKRDVKPEEVIFPLAPAKPILKTPNFFNKKRIALENEQLTAEYEKRLERYNKEFDRCKRQEKENLEKAQKKKEANVAKLESDVKKYRKEMDSLQKKIDEKTARSADLPVPAAGIKHLVDSEISATEKTLKKLYDCRNRLYSCNIIFDKYRNIVALSSFYEYLMAGRCETLEGTNGAYNIYEAEIRADRIISQLDEVIVSLDQIKKNQYMIYNKLNEMSRILSSLSNSMKSAAGSLSEIKINTDNMSTYLKSIDTNTAVIAHNSAVTAYHSKVNAELTNALGFMVALK